MRAYFEEGADIGDLEELVRLGVDVGLNAAESRNALILRVGQDGVVAAERHASVLGITGVPTYVFDGQYTISGAQEVGIFARVFDQVAEFASARGHSLLKDGELTGQLRSHIVSLADPACQLHGQVVTPFLNLRKAARAEGIDLKPVSSFRDFDRQLAIWNGKFSGERPMRAQTENRSKPRAWRRANASRRFCCGRRCPAPADITGEPTSISSTATPMRKASRTS